MAMLYRPQDGVAADFIPLYRDGAYHLFYQLRLEPGRGRMVFDRWPRPGDQPFMLERPLDVEAGQPVRLRVLVGGTCVVVYANDRVALCCRMYEHREGRLGLFVAEGEATFDRVSIREGSAAL